MCNNHSTTVSQNSTLEFLEDRTKSGKQRDWRGKKLRSLLMSEHFHAAGLERKAGCVRQCADTLIFKRTDDGLLRLYQAWFCKVRLCPMCNWRRSLKIACQNKRIVETINQREKVNWLFLTLTVRNTDAEGLPETLSAMSEGFRRLTMYKPFKASVKGFFRALEVTRNRDMKSDFFGTYHPHFHVLLCVSPSYFKKKELYITQSEWTNLWKRAMRLDYTPVVHVQKVKPKKVVDIGDLEDYQKELAEQSAILEVSKYPVKDTDVIRGDEVTEENVETVLTLDNALAYRRLIGYGGLLKQVHKELNLDDAEHGDLVDINEDDEVANGVFDVIARWHVGVRNYVILDQH